MSHAYSRLHYHLVFSTKERKRQIVPEIKDRLYAYMNGIIRNLDGVVEEIGGVEDHVHIRFFSPPKHSLSDVIRDLKANSSGWVHETWPARAAFAWQRGYGIFSVSESNVEAVREYIRNQEEHHRQMTFEDEYLALLRKHHVEYDLRYVFA
jgi:REP element-mobilizing transposase RayT